MPELPEAETMASDLEKNVTGLTIADVLVAYDPIVASDPDRFVSILKGQTIKNVGRLGKWVKINLASGGALLVHLKMTGQFLLGDWPKSLEGEWPSHTHAAFLLKGAKVIKTLFYKDIRKFGRLRAFTKEELPLFLNELGLGPDPLTIEFKEFHQIMSSKNARLKQVLLDQSVLSGLGNIYADEALFAAGLAPNRIASTLRPSDSARLLDCIQLILDQAIESRGSTVENYQGLEGPGTYQHQHQVYGKKGQNCPKCGTVLVGSKIAGRSTVHCPTCQK
jgi:formamidopyrimidine-DNA glycosylase